MVNVKIEGERGRVFRGEATRIQRGEGRGGEGSERERERSL